MEKRQQILRPAQDRIPRRGQSQGEEDSAQGDHKNRTRSGQRHWWPLIWLRRVFSGGANYLMRLRYQTRATPFLSCVMEKGSIPIVRAILCAAAPLPSTLLRADETCHICLSSHLSVGLVAATPRNIVEVRSAPMKRDLTSMFFIYPNYTVTTGQGKR